MKRPSDPQSPARELADFIRSLSIGNAERPAPATLAGWEDRLSGVRRGLARSFGRIPESPCALEPEILGTLARRGYAIERLTFQSRPGVRVTANLYRPDPVVARAPGVLSVHGHWAWARMDEHVQPRCIGLAKLGYIVLCVDAFGAGERAVVPAAGSYHGGLLGASLWPVGTPLLGLQVYDNRRAVDYLVSRPEVDPTKLAVTGASGGGNQTLYAGATDERLTAVIPVCGIGTYDSYIGSACCVCEVNSGGAAYATTGDVLAMIAPRALLVISASRDALQFSAPQAAKSVAWARERYRLLGADAKIRHITIDSGHDYNQAMREAMYGWVEEWLRGRGDGGPIAEPEIKVEEVAALRCYPDGVSRPKSIMTIPEFARQEGRARLAILPAPPDHPDRWKADAERMRASLRDRILGGLPAKPPLEFRQLPRPAGPEIALLAERGIESVGRLTASAADRPGTTIVVSAAAYPAVNQPPAGSPAQNPPTGWLGGGGAVLELRNPRGTDGDPAQLHPVAGIADHSSAEWALWVGRPLLGVWVGDIVRWLDFLDDPAGGPIKKSLGLKAASRPYTLVGVGPLGTTAVIAAALDPRVESVVSVGGLVSFVARSSRPWSGVPMGLIAPNVLDVGDIGQIAALLAPRTLRIAGGVVSEGDWATQDMLEQEFTFTRAIYTLLGVPDRLAISPRAEPPQAPP
jgi:dienelactone hydrolase